MARLIRFYKPYGVLSQFTTRDERPTLADFIVQVLVGPDAANARQGVSTITLDRLRAGIELRDGVRRASRAERLREPNSLPARTPPVEARHAKTCAWLRIGMSTGRNRQVRRLRAAADPSGSATCSPDSRR